MAIDSVASLLETLRQNQLLDPSQLSEAQAEARRITDPRALAQRMMKRNWLTPYQVNQIFQNQAGTLVLGQYRLLERLGEGGMGQVFKARHVAMGRIVALKVVRRERLDNENAVKRFRREIDIAGQLIHPNIVRAFDADQVAGTHYFAMEFVDGIDLSRLVKEKGPLPIATACDYIRQAAIGLQHAHDRGLVHRDIKPGNLLLAKVEPVVNGGQRSLSFQGKWTGSDLGKFLVRILDMGLARIADIGDGETGITLSQDGTVMGTPDYMSPEQAKNSSKVDSRADIYSLGCTLYFLLTAQVPFPGTSNIEKLIQHQMDTPAPVERLRSEVPVPLRGILQKMMAKRPDDRVQKASDVAKLLGPWCDPTAATPAPSAGRGRRDTLPAMAAVPAAVPPRPPARPDDGAVKRSTTVMMLRNLLIDPTSHRVRRLSLVIIAVAVIGLLGMFLVVLSLVAGLASQRGDSPPTAAIGRASAPTTERRASLEPIVRYLPDSTSYLWTIRLREVARTAVFKQNDGLIRASLLSYGQVVQPYGIDLYGDVERAVHVMIESGTQTPDWFVVLQGSFDARKFQEFADRGRPRVRHRRMGKGAGGLSYYESQPGPGETGSTFLALVNANTFVFGNAERLMTNVLPKGSGARPADLNDKDLKRVLDSLDDRSNLFMAIGGSKVTDGVTLLNSSGIRSVGCGFQIGDDVQANCVFTAKDAATAESLRTHVPVIFKSILDSLDPSQGLSGSVNSLSPTLGDRDPTLSLQTRFTGAQIGKFLGRKS